MVGTRYRPTQARANVNERAGGRCALTFCGDDTQLELRRVRRNRAREHVAARVAVDVRHPIERGVERGNRRELVLVAEAECGGRGRAASGRRNLQTPRATVVSDPYTDVRSCRCRRLDEKRT